MNKNEAKETKKEPAKEEIIAVIKRQLDGVFGKARKAVAEDRNENIAMIKVEEEVRGLLDKLKE